MKTIMILRGEILKKLRRDKYLVIMILPVTIFFIIFCYGPMYGLIMAFKDYQIGLGLYKSPWVGLKWFYEFFHGVYFWRLIRNTVLLSSFGIIFGMPVSIVFALLLNEVRNIYFKRVVQTITYFPNFISTVIMVSLVFMIFTYPNGIVNRLIGNIGLEPINFLQESKMFAPLYIGSGIWQGFGWGSILYIAALTSINPELYESAVIDGANRLQQMVYISIPCIFTTIITVLILNIGSLFSVGYEKIILMYNPLTYETADVISTYVYRKGIVDSSYSFSTAVGLFNSVINFTILYITNKISKRITQMGIW